MSIRENRNWLVILFFLGSIFLILYTINVFGNLGLIFWEIAFILIIPCLIGIIWSIRRIIGVKKERIQKYRHPLVVFTLIISFFFSIFAIIPFLCVNPLGNQFETIFKDKLGDDYWEKIPEEYRERLKAPGNYFDRIDLGFFLNRKLSIDSDISYGSEEYQKFDMYDNPNIKKDEKPAVIVIHGGGSTTFASKESINYVWACKYFASLGFVAFCVEYTPAPIEPFPKGVADVMKAIVYIKNHADDYNIDNNSIVLFGSSRGGHLVTQVAYTGVNNDNWWREHGGNYTTAELEVACVVDLYGAVDQFYAFEHNGFLASRNKIIFDGTPEEKEELYEHHTVKNYVSKNCPPTLIIHGSIDKMVQVGESLGLVEELEGSDAFYIYLEVPFGQHGFEAVPGTAGNLLVYYFIPRFVLFILYG